MAVRYFFTILAVSNFLEMPCKASFYKPFDVLRNSDLFVDKTFLITKFLSGTTQHALVTAPPGFGKTTDLDMIRRFVEIDILPNGTMKTDKLSHKNYKTFADIVPSTGKYLMAFTHKLTFENHFGQYPVIWLDLDFKGVKIYDKLSFMRHLLNGTIKEAFEHHSYLLNSSEVSATDKDIFREFLCYNCHSPGHVVRCCSPRFGIGLLKKLLKKHFHRDSFVLLDNCDAPLRELILDPKQDNKEAIEIIFELTNILEAIPDFDFAVGAEPPVRAFVTGALKPFYRMRHSWKPSYRAEFYQHIHGFVRSHISNAYGLTYPELEALLQSRRLNLEVSQLEAWYGGFEEVNDNYRRYTYHNQFANTQSVISFLASRTSKFKPYWTEFESLSAFKPAFAPECFGQHIVECFRGCTSLSSTNGHIFLETWIEAQEMLRNLQKIPLLPSQCTDKTRHYFMMYLGRLGYLTYTCVLRKEFNFKIPNFEVKEYFKETLYNAIVAKPPLNGDGRFRLELFEAISGVDGSELSMRRFAEALITLLIASERCQHVVRVDSATLAHSIRVHLLYRLFQFNVKYVKTAMGGDLVFAIVGKGGLSAFAVKLQLSDTLEAVNQTVLQTYLDLFVSSIAQNFRDKAAAKVAANLNCVKNVCQFSYLCNSTNSRYENVIEIEKEDVLKNATARWKSF